MPPFDYTSIRDNVVQVQIKDKGKLATLLGPGVATSGQPAWDPQPGADVEQPVWIVETELKARDVDGTVVQITDTMFLASPEGVITIEPELATRLLLDGRKWQVVQVKRIKPGGTLMAWKVIARR